MSDLIGITGAALVLVAWLYETYESVKNHRALVDLRFAVVYALGNIFLVAYSWLIQNMIFFTISSVILVVVFCEIIYTLVKLRRK